MALVLSTGTKVCHVKLVFYGDTILIEHGEKVRYLGIDAPGLGNEGKKSEFLCRAAPGFDSSGSGRNA
jgi:endonuclease YncB( thermonuclease family)